MSKKIREREELYNRWIEVSKLPFTGWDFSLISGKSKSDPLAWDYRKEVQNLMHGVKTLLDIGTGGGEFLSSFSKLPKHTYTTESYPPNVPIAKKRLESLKVKVIQVDKPADLPFENGSFDLIINRHSDYDPSQVNRICKRNGTFITQQVGSENWSDLKRILDYQQKEADRWDLEVATAQINQAGFEITKCAEITNCKDYFRDVESIIYHLMNIPWEIPDFSVDKYFDKLLLLYKENMDKEWLIFNNHRFYFIAKKIN